MQALQPPDTSESADGVSVSPEPTQIQKDVDLIGGSVNLTQDRVGLNKGGVTATQSDTSSMTSSQPKVYVDMVITPQGPELASINYNQLKSHCQTLLHQANR